MGSTGTGESMGMGKKEDKASCKRQSSNLMGGEGRSKCKDLIVGGLVNLARSLC